MTEQKQKVVFVTAFHPQISKNILSTEAFIRLRDSGKYCIVLLVPDTKRDFFERYYSHENVAIEGFEVQPFLEGRFEYFMNLVSRLLVNTHYLHYKRRELLDTNRSILGWLRHLARETFVLLFSDNKLFARIFRTFDSFGSRSLIFEELLEKYNPVVVFSTDLFEQLGAQLMREASKKGIKTVGMVRSWDNCLSKGLLRVVPDIAIVNNEVIKSELVTIHSVPDEHIKVVGLPQFDTFITIPPTSREVFFAENGLDSSKKLIMFAPAGSILSDTDADICDILISAKEKGLLPSNIQFFVRNHPQHPAKLQKFKGIPDVFVQMPGEILDKNTHKETELTPTDQEFLRNIVAHTDVLVWVATSLCLDVLIHDVPEVVVNFDGYQEKEYYKSVKRYHDEDHMKKMFEHRPFQIANTADELIERINMYLRDSSIDSKQRAIVREQQLFSLDGKAGIRVAQVLESALED